MDGASDLTAGRILSTVADEEERSAQTEAAEFLRALLTDGPRAASEVKTEARKAGISDITLRRAKDRLRVRAQKTGGRFGVAGQQWMWVLPEDAHGAPEGAQINTDEHLLASDTDKGTYSQHLAEDAHPSEFEHLLRGDEHLLAPPPDIYIPPGATDEEVDRILAGLYQPARAGG